MNPIVVSYPRTGSKVLTDIIYNYSKQYFNSQGCLQEFLLPSWYRVDNFKFVDNKIIGDYYDLPKPLWNNIKKFNIKEEIDNITNERISWLKQNPNYVFKLMINPRVLDSVYEFCLDNFFCIFLERRNNLRSFLSFLFLTETYHHHKLGSNTLLKSETKVTFYENFGISWISSYYTFKSLKENSRNKSCLVYEDIFSNGKIDEKIILDHLGWKTDEKFIPCKLKTIPTPYEDEDLISYFTNKDELIKFINQNSSVFNQIIV